MRVAETCMAVVVAARPISIYELPPAVFDSEMSGRGEQCGTRKSGGREIALPTPHGKSVEGHGPIVFVI